MSGATIASLDGGGADAGSSPRNNEENMKGRVMLAAVLALFVSGSVPVDVSTISEDQTGLEADGVIVDAASATQEFEVPFDLPMAPDSRLVDPWEYESGSGRMEAYGAIVTTGTAETAMAFFEKALVDAGFEIYSRGTDTGRLFIAGKRDADRFQIGHKEDMEDLADGETGLNYLASWS